MKGQISPIIGHFLLYFLKETGRNCPDHGYPFVDTLLVLDDDDAVVDIEDRLAKENNKKVIVECRRAGRTAPLLNQLVCILPEKGWHDSILNSKSSS